MKFSATLAAFALSLAAVADAGATEQLLKKNRCTSCHALSGKNVGPSFRDVAAKYKADKEAEARLIKKILEGGKGVWGGLAMPAKGGFPDLADNEVQPMVKYILSL